MTLIPYNRRSESFKKLLVRGIGNLGRNIFWGQTNREDGLNKSSAVSLATNKISTLLTLDANKIPTLEWTTDKEVAKENAPIYCRTILNGSKGKGIIIANNPEEVVNAPLYTKKLDDYLEYRVHVMNGEVFYAQLKKPRYEGVSTTIKTGKDYYFSKRNIEIISPELKRLAIQTIKCLELDFGAVDLLKKGSDIRVLEVNTAPGLDNSTANAYAEAFKKHYKTTFSLRGYYNA